MVIVLSRKKKVFNERSYHKVLEWSFGGQKEFGQRKSRIKGKDSSSCDNTPKLANLPHK
jgi:hypothetical protein